MKEKRKYQGKDVNLQREVNLFLLNMHACIWKNTWNWSKYLYAVSLLCF